MKSDVEKFCGDHVKGSSSALAGGIFRFEGKS